MIWVNTHFEDWSGARVLTLKPDSRPAVIVKVITWEDSALAQVIHQEQVTPTFGHSTAVIMPLARAVRAAIRACSIGAEALRVR